MGYGNEEAHEFEWTICRSNLIAQAAEGTSAPVAALFKDTCQTSSLLEVRVRGASLAGGPASVTLGLWRLTGGVVDKLGLIVINAADIATPIPTLWEVHGKSVYVTIESFAGGAGQSFTGSVDVRPCFGSV